MQDNQFIFSSYTYNTDRTEYSFSYEIIADKKYQFVEKLLLPKIPVEIPEKLLDELLFNIHLMLGISYWKLHCPAKIVIKTKPLTKDQAEFWNKVYTKGLGEFFYKNKIDYRALVNFPYEESVQVQPTSFLRKNRSLVGIGGGKDSVVVAELLKENDGDFSTFIIENRKHNEVAANVAKIVGRDLIIVKRQIDTQLFVLNFTKGVYNGHIPISAVYAFIGVLLAVSYDYSYVVVGNEKSASYGNKEYFGQIINHQWSKSSEFENLFREYVKKFVTYDVSYFSILRPFFEVKITEIFAKYSQYFPIFSSCNRIDKIVQTSSLKSHWCCECPKCAFVFVMLATFISKEDVVKIFGENLLNKESLINTYKELLGITGIKPFECVGTPDEVMVAFYLTHKKGEFDEDVVMKMFLGEVLLKIKNIEEIKQKVFEVDDVSSIPEGFRKLITK